MNRAKERRGGGAVSARVQVAFAVEGPATIRSRTDAVRRAAPEDDRKAGVDRGRAAGARKATVVRAENRGGGDERFTLQTLIDSVPDNLWIKDLESRFVLANKATAIRMGLAGADDLIGKTDLELCPPETAHRYFADERKIIESGQP